MIDRCHYDCRTCLLPVAAVQNFYTTSSSSNPAAKIWCKFFLPTKNRGEERKEERKFAKFCQQRVTVTYMQSQHVFILDKKSPEVINDCNYLDFEIFFRSFSHQERKNGQIYWFFRVSIIFLKFSPFFAKNTIKAQLFTTTAFKIHTFFIKLQKLSANRKSLSTL